MTITETKIKGAYIIERKALADKRGYFVRMTDIKELAAAVLCADFVQVNMSQNIKKGTLRGLHSQTGEAAEDKLVSCTRGSIFDVCVDVREDSPTYCQWVGAELSEENGLSLYVPKGCAHGYLTLTDDAQVLYFVTHEYVSGAEKGYRYNEPKFGIKWPTSEPFVMSPKDLSWGLL